MISQRAYISKCNGTTSFRFNSKFFKPPDGGMISEFLRVFLCIGYQRYHRACVLALWFYLMIEDSLVVIILSELVKDVFKLLHRRNNQVVWGFVFYSF